MSISYSFKDNIIILETAGRYTPDELKAKISQALDDDHCSEDAVLLIDLREDLSVLERKQEELRDMSFFLGQIRNRINRRLGMVTDSELAYGLMNMAKVYDESMGIQCEVFSDIDKACEWLTAPVEVQPEKP